MPYISSDKRFYMEPGVNPKIEELNFVLISVCKDYLKSKTESYSTYNEIISALERCKLELYRRKIAFYEDTKIIQNGDVY